MEQRLRRREMARMAEHDIAGPQSPREQYFALVDQPPVSASSLRWRSWSSASASYSRATQLGMAVLRRATNHWRSRELGQGGFGRVYEGQLAPFGRVAIKRLRLENNGGQGKREFVAELEVLAGLR